MVSGRVGFNVNSWLKNCFIYIQVRNTISQKNNLKNTRKVD
jgi:hypothetical protein